MIDQIVNYTKSGTEFSLGKITVSGHAWAETTRTVEKLQVVTTTVPLGTMQSLIDPSIKGAWQQWEADLELPMTGYEIWAKATDSEGDSQPVVQPQWNPKAICSMVVVPCAVRECLDEAN
ncbi:hypothetical protein O9929_17525 [Vibrio lentus]|nr:hypothetical protein [Vibrio lentus]